jgi:hypothetical protein
MPLRPYAFMPLRLSYIFVEFAPFFTNLNYFPVSSIAFELKKQIYFFLLPSDKKISFESFSIEIY